MSHEWLGLVQPVGLRSMKSRVDTEQFVEAQFTISNGTRVSRRFMIRDCLSSPFTIHDWSLSLVNHESPSLVSLARLAAGP